MWLNWGKYQCSVINEAITFLALLMVHIHERDECMSYDSLYMTLRHLLTVQCVQIKIKTTVV